MTFQTPCAVSINATQIQPKTFTNLRNSWLDLSWLYGLTTEANEGIREWAGGRISTSRFFQHPTRIVYDQTMWVRGGESASVNINPAFVRL